MAKVRTVRTPRRIKYNVVGDGYEAIGSYRCYSTRYQRSIFIKNGTYSDGATFAIDIDSDCWWYHDVLCRYGVFADGSKCTNHQASTILRDIMIEDGYPVWRANYWYLATLIKGGGKCRKNGILRLKDVKKNR